MRGEGVCVGVRRGTSHGREHSNVHSLGEKAPGLLLVRLSHPKVACGSRGGGVRLPGLFGQNRTVTNNTW